MSGSETTPAPPDAVEGVAESDLRALPIPTGIVYTARRGPVAQWLEPTAHNGLVAGSSPAGPTIDFNRCAMVVCRRGVHGRRYGRGTRRDEFRKAGDPGRDAARFVARQVAGERAPGLVVGEVHVAQRWPLASTTANALGDLDHGPGWREAAGRGHAGKIALPRMPSIPHRRPGAAASSAPRTPPRERFTRRWRGRRLLMWSEPPRAFSMMWSAPSHRGQACRSRRGECACRSRLGARRAGRRRVCGAPSPRRGRVSRVKEAQKKSSPPVLRSDMIDVLASRLMGPSKPWTRRGRCVLCALSISVSPLRRCLHLPGVLADALLVRRLYGSSQGRDS